MSESANINPTKSFWIISALALLWNLIALMPLYTQVFISPEVLAAMPMAERELYETSPSWMNTIFAIAVFGGIIGCILLLMRKALAITIFIISLVAVLIQMIYWIFLSSAMEVHGPTSIIMPLIVIGIAIFLVWYSRRTRSKAWIN